MKIISNARIVTADEEFLGSMTVKGECIDDASGVNTSVLEAEDWGGDYLLPGMVELHTDNLEKHLMPRPKVNWPVLSAIIAHDAQVAAAGITTVLDGLAVGDLDSDSLRTQTLTACSDGLREAAQAGILRADHFLHVRLELSDEKLLDLFDPFLHDERLKLVSLMDHTPGQRQWTDIGQYRTYVTGKRGWSEQKVDAMLELLLERQERYAQTNRSKIVARCTQRTDPVPLASHD
ncbi:MAG: alpha-D-ribose 1-methylphosphonate 5-triphosphate diphosphatase, partial [Burkholderia sp.]|nr:alpha-D-ribose 1-methylphosphonate 5-triphosphate diphosphatase [Burkholderia sp.]